MSREQSGAPAVGGPARGQQAIPPAGDIRNLRDLSSTLTNIRTVTEANKIIRVSSSMIRCMMFCDLCLFITGISLLTVGLTNSYYDKEKMIALGGIFGVAASISATCNSLATHGLKSWKRGFLVPWLLFYLVVLSVMVLGLARSFYYEHLNLRQVFLFLICLSLFSCWRHLQKQFLLMAYPKPELIVADVEAVVRELIVQHQDAEDSAATQYAAAKDLPPKYEEVEDFPPQYDPTTMVPTSSSVVMDMPPTPSVEGPAPSMEASSSCSTSGTVNAQQPPPRFN